MLANNAAIARVASDAIVVYVCIARTACNGDVHVCCRIKEVKHHSIFAVLRRGMRDRMDYRKA